MQEIKNILSPEQIWETLSEAEKEACVYLAMSDWQSGVGGDYLEVMGLLKDPEVDELVKRGVIETKPGWQFFQEIANGLKDRAQAIKGAMETNPLGRLGDEERKIQEEFDRNQGVAERKNEEPRYRLSTRTFHDYLNRTFGDQ